MTDWHVQVDLDGTLTQDQIEALADDAIATATIRGDERLVELTYRVQAGDLSAATVAALAHLARLAGVQALIAAGVLSDPQRLQLATDAAASRRLPLLGAAEAAARLGVSTSRLRQLENGDDFPAPVLELAGGKLYDAAAIDAFGKSRRRGPGRPPKAGR